MKFRVCPRAEVCPVDRLPQENVRETLSAFMKQILHGVGPTNLPLLNKGFRPQARSFTEGVVRRIIVIYQDFSYDYIIEKFKYRYIQSPVYRKARR